MNKKKLLTNAFVWSILYFGGIYVLVRYAIDFPLIWENVKDLRFYPEQAPARDVVADDFLLLWSKKIGEGSQHLVFTQILNPDNSSIVYITPNSMNSIDLLTGTELWTTTVPEDSIFHYFDDKIFSLDSYDGNVPFASIESISIPSKCNSSDLSTLRVYNPHTGEMMWEYSYQMVYPGEIYFKDNSAYIYGLTLSLFTKYFSIFEIDINSGHILGVECQSLKNYSRISTDEGILSSGYSPITRDWEWEKESDKPAFIVEGSKLIMVDHKTKEPLSQIEFTGFPLNPDSIQLIINGNILIVYLDDSNQFFAFQTK